MVCLDSDVLINFMKKKSDAIRKITELQSRDEPLCITAITNFELMKGAFRSGDMAEVERVAGFLAHFSLLSFDREVSTRCAEIFERLRSEGVMLDVFDVMIAASCLVHGQVLVTGNRKHFERIEGLVLG